MKLSKKPKKQTMILEETISTFTSIMKWAKLLGALPFRWNEKKRRIYVTKSYFALGRFALIVYGWLVYLGSLLYVLIYAYLENIQLYMYTRFVVILVGGLLPVMLLISNILKEQEIKSWVNSVLKFESWFSGK